MSTFAVFGMTETYAYEEAKKKVEPLDGKKKITEQEWLVRVAEYVDDQTTIKTRKVKLSGLFSSPAACRDWIDVAKKNREKI